MRTLAAVVLVWRRFQARLAPGVVFVTAFFGLLGMPALLQLAGPATVSLGVENRRPSPAPDWPTSLAAFAASPAQLDAYLADRFGLREPLIRLNNFLRWHVLDEIATPDLVVGRNGRVFLAGHNEVGTNALITVVCGAAATEDVIARATATVRGAIQAARSAGLDPTLLLVPTAARLYPQELPPRFAAACAGHQPLGDAVAARATDLPVVYPVAEMLNVGGIPKHRFHWAGAAPRSVAEAVAETGWGLPRTLTIPVARKSRSSDLNAFSPGLGMSDVIDEPQTRAAGVWECWLAACNGAGPPADAVPAMTGFKRPGTGRLLIMADSFGDDIAPDFVQEFAEVWVVHTNITRSMPATSRAALAAWVIRRFRGQRVLLVLHDLGSTTDFGRLVSDVVNPDQAAEGVHN